MAVAIIPFRESISRSGCVCVIVMRRIATEQSVCQMVLHRLVRAGDCLASKHKRRENNARLVKLSLTQADEKRMQESEIDVPFPSLFRVDTLRLEHGQSGERLMQMFTRGLVAMIRTGLRGERRSVILNGQFRFEFPLQEFFR